MTNKGHVLTNAHVVEECASIRVTTDEQNSPKASFSLKTLLTIWLLSKPR